MATCQASIATIYRNVAENISFRDVQFTDDFESVFITVTTDIPCHLYCRLTETKPQIHLQSVLRRGAPFMSELRFCFTSFEDNEQAEAGDTLTHTWEKPNWGFCVTKWCYFFGSVTGIYSPSTSPFFEHHNTFVIPPYGVFGPVIEERAYDNQGLGDPIYVSGNIWAFTQVAGSNLYIKSYSCDPLTGNISDTLLCTRTYVTGAVSGASRLFHVSGDIYGVVYRRYLYGTYNYSRLMTFSIDSSGFIGGIIADYQFATGDNEDFNYCGGDMYHVKDTVYAMAGRRTYDGQRLIVITWHISADGVTIEKEDDEVTLALGGQFKIDFNKGTSNLFIVFVHVRNGPTSVYTCWIDDTGEISNLEGENIDPAGPAAVAQLGIRAARINDYHFAVAYFTGVNYRVRTMMIQPGVPSVTLVDLKDGLFDKYPPTLLVRQHFYGYLIACGATLGNLLRTFNIYANYSIGDIIDSLAPPLSAYNSVLHHTGTSIIYTGTYTKSPTLEGMGFSISIT